MVDNVTDRRMDMRKMIMEAVLKEYAVHNDRNKAHILEDAMKRIPDMDLIVFAQELGIDTDKVLTEGK